MKKTNIYILLIALILYGIFWFMQQQQPSSVQSQQTIPVGVTPLQQSISVEQYKEVIMRNATLSFPEPAKREQAPASYPDEMKNLILPDARDIQTTRDSYADRTIGVTATYAVEKTLDATAHIFNGLKRNDLVNMHWTIKYGLVEFKSATFQAGVQMRYLEENRTQVEVIYKKL